VGETAAAPRVVVGVDGSASSLAALRWAVRQAGLTGGVVEAVVAWEYPSYYWYGWPPPSTGDSADWEANARQILDEAISKSTSPDDPVEIRTRVVKGNPAGVLINAAHDADLLVVGNRGHGGFTEALLGSVGQHCTQHARCPVVVVRGREER